MSKHRQLEVMRELGLPVPAFQTISYRDFQSGHLSRPAFPPPYAVRSSYRREDAAESSQAGQFKTVLNVASSDLPEAIALVFGSYPAPEGSVVLIQEMIEPDYSGVLFAFRAAAWKAEIIEGQGEALMSGRENARSLLLPRFTKMDQRLSWVWSFWSAWDGVSRHLNRALLQLSAHTQRLLGQLEAEHGLDIEFCVKQNELWLLQARPITTPEEAEEVLTSANHKEILPPKPSLLMTSIISAAGPRLFDYYRRLDPSLPARSFIEEAAYMPWINLSALLDTMVHWGLPTQLVCRSVGAEDFYRVGLRPWRALRKLPVFLKVLGQQWSAKRRIERWQKHIAGELDSRKKQREALWKDSPAQAFGAWRSDFARLYVELVTYMQILTGAMSGPVSLLDRLGVLPKLAAALKQKSISTDYLNAFRQWQSGQLSREGFLAQFGHRGFYESDIGQRRFLEYSEEEWQRLSGNAKACRSPAKRNHAWARLFAPIVGLIHTREWIRNESMKLFWSFRKELQQHCPFDPWEQRPADLQAYFQGKRDAAELLRKAPPPKAGWDMDTFLYNKLGRRLPVGLLYNVDKAAPLQDRGIGVFPGKVKGRVWRVEAASLDNLSPPDFDTIVLVADALDPGWAPYFSQVDGVVAYLGGVLSHASILLREARVPSVTQLPPSISLQTGDWVLIDGKTGSVQRIEETGQKEE